MNRITITSSDAYSNQSQGSSIGQEEITHSGITASDNLADDPKRIADDIYQSDSNHTSKILLTSFSTPSSSSTLSITPSFSSSNIQFSVDTNNEKRATLSNSNSLIKEKLLQDSSQLDKNQAARITQFISSVSARTLFNQEINPSENYSKTQIMHDNQIQNSNISKLHNNINCNSRNLFQKQTSKSSISSSSSSSSSSTISYHQQPSQNIKSQLNFTKPIIKNQDYQNLHRTTTNHSALSQFSPTKNSQSLIDHQSILFKSTVLSNPQTEPSNYGNLYYQYKNSQNISNSQMRINNQQKCSSSSKKNDQDNQFFLPQLQTYSSCGDTSSSTSMNSPNQFHLSCKPFSQIQKATPINQYNSSKKLPTSRSAANISNITDIQVLSLNNIDNMDSSSIFRRNSQEILKLSSSFTKLVQNGDTLSQQLSPIKIKQYNPLKIQQEEQQLQSSKRLQKIDKQEKKQNQKNITLNPLEGQNNLILKSPFAFHGLQLHPTDISNQKEDCFQSDFFQEYGSSSQVEKVESELTSPTKKIGGSKCSSIRIAEDESSQFFGTIREDENEDFDQTPMQSNNIFKQLGKAKRDELNKELLEEMGNDTNYLELVTEETELQSAQQESKKTRGRMMMINNNHNNKEFKNDKNMSNPNNNNGFYMSRGYSSGMRKQQYQSQHQLRGRSVQSEVDPQENSFSGQGGVYEQSMMSLDSNSTSSEYQFPQQHIFLASNMEGMKSEEDSDGSPIKRSQMESSLTRNNLEMLIKKDKQSSQSQFDGQGEFPNHPREQTENNNQSLGEELIDKYDQLSVQQKIAEIDRISNALHKQSEEFVEQEKILQEKETKIEEAKKELKQLKEDYAKMEQRVLKAKEYQPEDREEEESYSQYYLSLKQSADKLQQNIEQKELAIIQLNFQQQQIQRECSRDNQELSSLGRNFQEVESPNKSIQKKNNFASANDTSTTNSSTQQIVENKQKNNLIKNEDKVLKEGWLYKKKDSFLRSWKLRYFVLTASKVQYYKEESKKKLRGCINLSIASCKVADIQGKMFTLEIEGYKRKFELKSQAKYTTSEWVNLLQIAISQNEQLLKPCIHTLRMNQYYKQDLLTEEQFLSVAQSGDILLFETNNISAKFQRKFTGSKYDHVGLCVRFDDTDIRVFDSAYGHGVELNDWKDYIQTNNLYEKVCLRRLQGIDSKVVHEKLLTFILENIGKKYQFGMKKLLKISSKDEKGQEKDPKGYFCSELVAKFYKNIDILPQSKPSSYYWPSNNQIVIL